MKEAPTERKFVLTEDRDVITRAQGPGPAVRGSIILKLRDEEDEDASGVSLLKARIDLDEHVGNLVVIDSRDEEVDAIIPRNNRIEIHVAGTDHIAAVGKCLRFLSDEIARRVKEEKSGLIEYTGLSQVIELV